MRRKTDSSGANADACSPMLRRALTRTLTELSELQSSNIDAKAFRSNDKLHKDEIFEFDDPQARVAIDRQPVWIIRAPIFC